MIWEQTVNNTVNGLITIAVLDKSMDMINMGKKKKRKQKTKGKGLIPKNQYY